MMGHPIGALPRTPFCLFEAFPLKGKREIWREKQGVIYFMYHSGVSPFGGWRHHLSPASGGTITRAYDRVAYGEIASRCFIVPPLSGGKVVP